VTYYRGDYYAGDFWSKLGQGVKRLGKNIGKVAQTVAPIAGVLLPAVGAATLVGRGVAAARKVKAAGRTARAVMRNVSPAELASPVAVSAGGPDPFARGAAVAGRDGYSYWAMPGSGMRVQARNDATQDEISRAWHSHYAPRSQGARKAYRRRRAAKKRTSTRRRSSRRRTTRRRS